MHLPSFIARRYLFSKAHRNVINIISVVSAVAIGIGCMALIVILSVYNGFDKIVESSYNSYIPDYVITPAKGKVINLEDQSVSSAMKKISSDGDAEVFPVLEETVYVQYDVVQSIAKIKGVPRGYENLERLQDKTVDGDFEFYFGDLPRAVVEENLAATMMLKPQFSTPMEIYLPSRTEDISLVMPQSSLLSLEIRPAGIISLSSAEDKGTVYIPDSLARELMEMEKGECSRLEVYLASGKNRKSLMKEIASTLGEGYVLKDRYQQNETIYKMMKAEKFAIYMILLFVVIIISVNILASLSMLIIEKKEDIETYKALGMTNGSVRKSFVLHGWLICMVGAVAGVALGLVLCWIQHRFHLIGLPGNFVISYYPVVVKISDVVLTLLSVAVIGLVMAYIPARSIRANKK
ncbi:MAG: ABC transporter permease [Bacteroidales bacterium]|nr:ABC transporter permease [Bacteroidales bacterium]